MATNRQWTQRKAEEEFSISRTVTLFCFISFAVWVSEMEDALGMRVRSIFTSFAPRVLLLLMEGKYLFQKCICRVLKESLVSISISLFRETRWENCLWLFWYGGKSMFLKKGKTTNKLMVLKDKPIFNRLWFVWSCLTCYYKMQLITGKLVHTIGTDQRDSQRGNERLKLNLKCNHLKVGFFNLNLR